MEKELITWLDGITEFSLYALIFTLPFSKSMVEIFFVIALTCWVVKKVIVYFYLLSASAKGSSRGGPASDRIRYSLKDKILGLIKAFKPVKTDLNLSIAGFVFIGFLSTVNSISLSLSLEGFFLKLFEWVMIYFIVAETINSKKKLNRILAVILFSMVLISIDGIFQFITGTDFIRNYSVAGHRIQASFGNPNSFAGWLVVMVLLALSLTYFGMNDWLNLIEKKYNWFKKAIRPILWIITGLLIFCLTLT